MKSRFWRTGTPIVLGVLAISLLGLWPAHRDSGAAQERIDSASAQIAELQAAAGTLTPLSLEAASIEARLNRLATLVPAEHDVAIFVVELDEIADRTGVELLDVVPTQSDDTVQDPATPAGWSSVLLAVRITGEYAEFVTFVDALADADRLVVIDQLAISSQGTDLLVGEFQLRLFSTNDPASGILARIVEGGEGQ